MTPYEEYFSYCVDRMPIYNLWRAAIRFVYDKNSCAFYHEAEMYKEINEWNKIIEHQKKIRYEAYGKTESDFAPEGRKGNVIDETAFQISQIKEMLDLDNAGLLQYEKDTLRLHSIDYKRLAKYKHFFPESQDPDGFKKGQAALKQAMIDNPFDYKKNE